MMHVLVTCMLRLYRLIISSISRISSGSRTIIGPFSGEIPDGDLSRGLSGQHEQCVPYGIGYCRCPDFGIRFHTGPDQPSFAVRDRMFLGDHDEPVPFWKVGLKKADFVMLDKWKIAYRKD